MGGLKGFADREGEVAAAGDVTFEVEPVTVVVAVAAAVIDDEDSDGIEAARGPVGMPLAPDARGVAGEVVAEAPPPPVLWIPL